MRIGLLGGTFDPVHNGHLFVAAAAQKQFSLDKVLFIPAWVSPHKQSQSPSASASDRCEMLKRAIAGHKNFELCTAEIERGGVSYTAATLRQLRSRYAHDAFFLILGDDAYRTFDAWQDPLFIKQNTTLIVAPRHPGGAIFLESPGVLALKMPLAAESATEIRKGRAGAVKDLPAAVVDYIRQKKLYVNQGA